MRLFAVSIDEINIYNWHCKPYYWRKRLKTQPRPRLSSSLASDIRVYGIGCSKHGPTDNLNTICRWIHGHKGPCQTVVCVWLRTFFRASDGQSFSKRPCRTSHRNDCLQQFVRSRQSARILSMYGIGTIQYRVGAIFCAGKKWQGSLKKWYFRQIYIVHNNGISM